MNKNVIREEWIDALPLDENGNVDLYSLFQAFQKAATRHAEEIDIGKDFYLPRHLLYVLCRIKAKFLAPFPKEGKIRLVTYALMPGRVSFLRDCFLEDESGKRILLLKTLWVLIDEKRRRIVLTDPLCERMEGLKEDVLSLPDVFDEELTALEEEEVSSPCLEYVVSEKDIDSNHHLNNTIYFRLVEKAGIQGRIKTLELDFEKECLLGDKILVYRKGDYYCGYRRGELSFKCKIEESL